MLEDSWTASEETKLLDSLLQKGEGNWEEISKNLGSTKGPLECQKHYEKFYLDNSSTFPSFTTNPGLRHDQPVIFAPIDDHVGGGSGIPRPVQRSTLHKDLAGYKICHFLHSFTKMATLGYLITVKGEFL